MAHDRRLPDRQVKPRVRANARALRRSLADAERVIWYGLRAHRLDGIGFRRQTPIGPYIVDFVSHQAKLIIEIDGGQHFESEHLRRDARRDAFLESKGFRVLKAYPADSGSSICSRGVDPAWLALLRGLSRLMMSQ